MQPFLFPFTELSSQSECYSNGEPIPGRPSISSRPHSPDGLDLSSGLHPPSKQQTPVNLHYPLVKRCGQHELLKSGLHRHKYSFSITTRKLQTRVSNNCYEEIIPNTQLYTVISTPSGDVLAVVDKNNIFRGIYNMSRRRRKLNMKKPHLVKPLTKEEWDECVVGYPLTKSDFLDLNN